MTSSARGHSLSLVGIEHYFGPVHALKEVSLAIEPGELIALLGPSGCGKTTLLQIIAGFLRPTSGEVRFDGARIDQVPANRRRIGMVFQNYALFPHMSVFENVAYGLRARSTPKAAVRAKVEEMLALVQMGRFAQRLPGELSGGQQQRVALARALAIEPGVVLLDEPFSALDKNLRLDMQIEIKSLLKSYGVTSIMVTHDQEEALSMADRIVVMNAGAIEQMDTPDTLYDRPATLFVNGFIGHASFLRGILVAPDRVKLEAGVEIQLPAAKNLLTGLPVLVALRPENLVIDQAGMPGTIPATVKVTLPLGASTVIDTHLASGEAVKINAARTGPSVALPPGTAVGLRILDPAGIGVFPAPHPDTP